jgi:hypothetical protein
MHKHRNLCAWISPFDELDALLGIARPGMKENC